MPHVVVQGSPVWILICELEALSILTFPEVLLENTRSDGCLELCWVGHMCIGPVE